MTARNLDEKNWYVRPDERSAIYGPYSMSQLQEYVKIGKILFNVLVSRDKNEWKSLEEALMGHERMPVGKATVITRVQELEKFENYRILEELGRGGMGIVYKALDLRLQREVAIKILLRAEESELKRFAREARIYAQLKHPNIVNILEFGETPVPFICMEYIEGRPLSQLIQSDLLSISQAVQIFRKICSALEHAHRQKVIHRDIKPGNIMIDIHGEPKVMDFGLAKIVDREKSLSQPGEIMGTPKYMAPEQVNALEVDRRADIYSLGSVFYEMLTGRTPFEGDSIFNILSQMANNDPLMPCDLDPSIPFDLQTVCMKCLEKKPKRRYFSVRLLERDLDLFLENRPIASRPPSAVDRMVKWTHRNKALTAFLAMLLIGLSMSVMALGNQIRLNRIKLAREYKVGCSLFHKREMAQAQRKFESQEQTLESRWMRGAVFFIQRDFKKALEQFDAALSFSPEALHRSRLWLFKALCYADAGELEQALGAWQTSAGDYFKGTGKKVDPKNYLPELERLNGQSVELPFHMPFPDDIQEWKDAAYHLVIDLLPPEEGYEGRMRISSRKEKFSFDDRDSLFQELNKTAFMLEKEICPWGKYLMEKGEKKHPYPSEIKEMLFYVEGKWILDMATPYWTRLPLEHQRRYAKLYQEGYAAQLSGNPVVRREWQHGQASFQMVLVPPGHFLMGRPFMEEGEGPLHPVIVPDSYWMSETEVTQEQWRQVMGGDSPWLKEDGTPRRYSQNHPHAPVTFVNLPLIHAFLDVLKKSGKKYELPDEIRWEYACKAGSAAIRDCGIQNEEVYDDYFWYSKNAFDISSPEKSHPQIVKQKRPNGWGIYDMLGNVSELCNNRYFAYSSRRTRLSNLEKHLLIKPGMDENEIDWKAHKTQPIVYKGGNISSKLEECTATRREQTYVGIVNAMLGFRFLEMD